MIEKTMAGKTYLCDLCQNEREPSELLGAKIERAGLVSATESEGATIHVCKECVEWAINATPLAGRIRRR